MSFFSTSFASFPSVLIPVIFFLIVECNISVPMTVTQPSSTRYDWLLCVLLNTDLVEIVGFHCQCDILLAKQGLPLLPNL